RDTPGRIERPPAERRGRLPGGDHRCAAAGRLNWMAGTGGLTATTTATPGGAGSHVRRRSLEAGGHVREKHDSQAYALNRRARKSYDTQPNLLRSSPPPSSAPPPPFLPSSIPPVLPSVLYSIPCEYSRRHCRRRRDRARGGAAPDVRHHFAPRRR